MVASKAVAHLRRSEQDAEERAERIQSTVVLFKMERMTPRSLSPALVVAEISRRIPSCRGGQATRSRRARDREERNGGAYAIKSLELADTDEARRFALRALLDAPTARTFPAGDHFEAHDLEYSPSREWLAVGGYRAAKILRADGREPISGPDVYKSAGFAALSLSFGDTGEHLVTLMRGDLRVWEVPIPESQ